METLAIGSLGMPRIISPPAEGTNCTYCGVPATAWDHYKRPYCHDHIGGSWRSAGYNPAEVIPCCKNCNSILGPVWMPGIAPRARFIRKRLIEKHARLLRSPDWSEEDYEHLQPRMEKFVRVMQRRKLIVRGRLQRLSVVGKHHYGPREELQILLLQLERRGIEGAQRIRELVEALLDEKTPFYVSSLPDATEDDGKSFHGLAGRVN